MRSTKLPRVSRGRAKHVIALLVVPDAVAVEVALVQQVFGRRMSSIAAITGEPDSPYEVVLCGEQPRHTLPSGADLGELAPLDTMLTADIVARWNELFSEPPTVTPVDILAAKRPG
jgi:hypothetical protein